MISLEQAALGCRMPYADWLALNRTWIFDHSDLMRTVAPFPPTDLMTNTSGLSEQRDFASHGADIYDALSRASDRPLTAFQSILDFGCGCGRLARLFAGHPGQIQGCDIDARHVNWINDNLRFMRAKVSRVVPPIPFANDEFDAVISISIFTHLTEASQDSFLAELHRVCQPEGRLFLTVHGERALQRALDEPRIRAMLDMAEQPFQQARADFMDGKHGFVLQHGHLTTTVAGAHQNGSSAKAVDEPFEYGISFTPEAYIREHWAKWFEVLDYRVGGIHDFQDIVVLRPIKR